MGDAGWVTFNRADWAAFRANTVLVLGAADLEELRGTNELLDADEADAVYVPLSNLLMSQVTHAPYLIGIAGSVAVGKSTIARILQALLARWPHHPRVELVTTDGFLHPNAVLAERGLLDRKGFPESYDVRRLIEFLTAVRSGVAEIEVPVYSHLLYDIVDERQVVRKPDIVLVEGLNVLQPGPVSEAFDFTIYVDADEDDIERWFIARIHALRSTVFTEDKSFFHRYASVTAEEVDAFAHSVWGTINGPNLRDNIAPTREHAHLVLEKGPDHAVRAVHLRRG